MFKFFKNGKVIGNLSPKESEGYHHHILCNLDRYIVEILRDKISGYVLMQEEEGFYLPKEFHTDPASWLAILNKIKFSFDQAYIRFFNLENPETKNKTAKQLAEIDKRVQEGFELFGKYLLDLKEIEK